MDYKKAQLDEILFMVNKGFAYNDLLSMPIYLRRYFITYILDVEKAE